MKNLVGNVEEEQEVETIEEADVAQASDVLGKVAAIEEKVDEHESVVTLAAMMSGLSWSPLSVDRLQIHAEEILSGLLERIPRLSVRTSKNQHQALSFGDGRGRVVCKFWFAKSKVCIETPILEGRSYKVGQSRYLDEKIGLSQKNRAAVIREIKKYIADRGWES